ncbi:MAG: hypothetical protein AAF125_17505, partial [Chloroflexota bacterium]
MSGPQSRQSAFEDAPMDDLLDILLRQFKRPLANFGVELTATNVEAVAGRLAAREPLDALTVEIRDGLVEVVAESQAWFEAHDLTFETSLQTEMGDMPGWETTGEFLELANEKSNAELRVAGASALLVAMGADNHTDTLRFLIANPSLDDVSAIMARRVLESPVP